MSTDTLADRCAPANNLVDRQRRWSAPSTRSLGENIGDVSGLTIAYRAYQILLAGRDAPVLDGFTGDQRFFLGLGQLWRIKATDEAMGNRVQTAPHSPPEFRVNGPLPNMPG